MLLHIWSDASTAANALELGLVIISTAAVGGLHLWLRSLFADFRSELALSRPLKTNAIGELRSQRRLRRPRHRAGQ
jgi:hypothetical protein